MRAAVGVALALAFPMGCGSPGSTEEDASPVATRSLAIDEDETFDLLRVAIRHLSRNKFRSMAYGRPREALLLDPVLQQPGILQQHGWDQPSSQRIPTTLLEDLESSGTITGLCGADCWPGDNQIKVSLSLPSPPDRDTGMVHVGVRVVGVFPPSGPREGGLFINDFRYDLVRSGETWVVEGTRLTYAAHGPYPPRWP